MDGLKPTILDALPLVNALYRTHAGSCGCCLHVVLDDGNVGDDTVDYCIGYATERGHVKCVEIGTMLRRMSKTQRLKVYRSHT